MRVDVRGFLIAFACGAAISGAVLSAAATASADPLPPAPSDPSSAPVEPAPDPLAPLGAVNNPAPAVDANQVASGDAPIIPPPNGVPHLASPDALPPGSTMENQDTDGPNVSYLKDLMSAVQNHEISGKEALLMGLAQRGMNTPYPTLPPGPNRPSSPGAPGDAAAAPGDPAAPPPPAG
jgi:resuscitation-promoting factor RpfA